MPRALVVPAGGFDCASTRSKNEPPLNRYAVPRLGLFYFAGIAAILRRDTLSERRHSEVE